MCLVAGERFCAFIFNPTGEAAHRASRLKQVIRILIADDYPITRRGIIDVATKGLRGVVCGEASDNPELLESIKHQRWDLVILGMPLPYEGGLSVLRELKLLRPTLPVLVVSEHVEVWFGKRILRAGASGYISKSSSLEEFTEAIETVLRKRLYISPELSEKLAEDALEGSERPPHENLSDREFEILTLIGSGKSPTEIAARLSLTVATVSSYRARILAKLAMSSTAELIHYAVKQQLVP